MPARDTILDAAAAVMRTKGLARTTTKEIAREAGYSEATLYKHFADKQEIFLGVLGERVPGIVAPGRLVGTATVADNLAILTSQLLAFYTLTFPMAASIFSSPELLTGWREGLASKGKGPRGPVEMLRSYLEAEVMGGRLSGAVDTLSVAQLLCGAAMQQAFLACFDGLDEVPDIDGLARALVAATGLGQSS